MIVYRNNIYLKLFNLLVCWLELLAYFHAFIIIFNYVKEQKVNSYTNKIF